MIDVNMLTKVYPRKDGAVHALSDVTLSVGEGEFFGLLGLNGAGKTTLLKVLSTLILPGGGRASVGGYDVVARPDMVRRSIGFCTGEPRLYLRLSAEENLRFFGSLYGLSPVVIAERINGLLEFFGLQSVRRRLAKDFSTGMKKKLQIIRTLLHDPAVLLLDEPTSGLDYASTLEMYELIAALNEERNKTIVYTTHNLHEVEELCSRVAIIHRGRIICDATVSELKRRYPRPNVVTVKLWASGKDAGGVIAGTPGVKAILERGTECTRDGELEVFRLEVEHPQQATGELTGRLIPGFELAGLYVDEPDLEEVFLLETSRRGETA